KITGFKEIEIALVYEINRQKKAVAAGEKLFVETRGWDADNESTYSMRKKETEADYGYIIDPDLVPITINDSYRKEITDVEMPVVFANRIAKEFGVSKEDAYIIANQKAFGSLYKKAISINPKKATNWFRHVLPTPFVAKYKDISFVESVNEEALLELFSLYVESKVSDKVMKEILEKLVEENFSPKDYLKEHGLEMVSNTGDLENWCKEAIVENPAAVTDFKNGEQKSLNFLVGQVMKKSKGKANPAEVSKIIQGLV
ncbi:MAG: hypothetical protein ACMXYK_04065, partial [Candidatus Woesearchaeota archaeon]